MILDVLGGLSIGSLGPAKRVDREAKSAREPSLGSACAWMVFVAEEIACWMDGERWTDCGTMFLSQFHEAFKRDPECLDKFYKRFSVLYQRMICVLSKINKTAQ